MKSADNVRKIDLEAHFYTKEYIKVLCRNKRYPRCISDKQTRDFWLWYFPDTVQLLGGGFLDKLLDIGEGRLREMDMVGVDVQVLSLSAPGVEQFNPSIGTALARSINDELSEVIQKYSNRFIGFATLAPKSPGEAADELERAVKDLGFRGWKTHSNFGDTYLDDKKYWCILEKAERLDVPIYLHPTVPAIPQLRTYGFALAGPSFGFGFETALCLMRMIYSGVFDKYPKLKIILGHLGEALPFLLKRMDFVYVKSRFDFPGKPKLAKKPSDYLKSNVYVTTSGNYFQPAFMCTYQALGADKILFATDYPYENISECVHFLEGLPIPQEDKHKIYCSNAEVLNIKCEMEER